MRDIKLDAPYQTYCVNKSATVKRMRKHLKFLMEYAYLLNKEPNETKDYVEEQDDLINYVSYTKSIIQCSNASSIPQSTKLLEAMERQEEHQRQVKALRERREMHCLWLLQGMEYLPEKEKTVLIYKYVERMSNAWICRRMNQISLSTLNRLHYKACIDLARLLELEVVDKVATTKKE